MRGRSGLEISFVSDQRVRLPLAHEREFWHIAREALINVERHAHASHVHVWMRSDGRTLEVLVQDNGAGMPGGSEYKAGCFGLVAMQERIYTLGGNMDICSREKQGSAIYVTLPIESPVVKIS